MKETYMCIRKNDTWALKLKWYDFYIYSAVSTLLDRSKHFTLHPLAYLFIPAPTRLLWEALSQLFCEYYSLTLPPLLFARYSFIQLSELGHRGENKNDQSSKRKQMGLEPGLFPFRGRHSTIFYH